MWYIPPHQSKPNSGDVLKTLQFQNVKTTNLFLKIHHPFSEASLETPRTLSFQRDDRIFKMIAWAEGK